MSDLLVLAETDGRTVLPSTLPTMTFAQAFCGMTGGSFDILILGAPGIEGEAEGQREAGRVEAVYLRLAVAVGVPEDPDTARLALGDE